MLLGKGCRFFFAKSEKSRFFKRVKHLPCRYRCIGCYPNYLRNGFANLIESLLVIRENRIHHRQLQSLPTCRTTGIGWVNLSTTQYHLCYANHGSRNNTFVKRKIWLICDKKINIRLRKESFYPAISISSAMVWLSKAWNTLPGKTFTNCLRSCSKCNCRQWQSFFAGLKEDDLRNRFTILEN